MMFKKLGKCLFWAVLLFATGYGALSVGQKAVRLIQKENQLLASAGGQAINALRSVGEAGQTFVARAGQTQINLLFVGLNDAWSEPEAIMLAAVDLDNEQVQITQFGLNATVDRKGKATSVGALYSAAYSAACKQGDSSEEAVRKGIIALKGCLKEQMNISIDHYLSMNNSGLRKLVDSVDGITVNLSEPIDCENEARDLHIHHPSGRVELNADEAAELIRWGGNCAESSSAKLVLSALFRKVRSEFSLSTALALLNASMRCTVSDLSLPDLIPLAKGILNIPSSKIKMTAITDQI